ncbi:hypothetical protein BDZ89DRAFT_432061 [Hymenopellis radicata]|nr:hypothetical protein BDZ89DRAFT_432061 [Hymenopellis radicata]
MAADTSKKRARYTCKCLNMQIQASTPVDPVPPELAIEAGFTQVYVKQDGIMAAHPQLTLRIRSKAIPIDGTQRSAQFISLACLICRTLVYRVYQVTLTKVAAQEGPVIPKAGWVEEDVLHTPSGWIQVFEDVLTDAQVSRLESSPQFSNLFALVLPPLVPEVHHPTSLSMQSDPRSSTQAPNYLASMEPLFPNISTTTDPVLLRLSNIASEQSLRLRAQAEQEVSEIVNARMAQVAQAERELKLQVHTLLQAYRDGLRIAGEECKSLSPTPRPWKEASNVAVSRAAVSVHDFVPAKVPTQRVSPETPRISTLSASIATSTFHHPRAVKESAAGSRPSSLNSPSLLSNAEHRASSHGGSLLQIRRNHDDDLNTAASYKYFVIEEQMARLNAAMESRDKIRSRSESTEKAEETKADTVVPAAAPGSSEGPKKEEAPPLSPTSSKPRRKVTFDLNTTSSDQLENNRPDRDAGEMVFDLEDETGEDRPSESGLVLPLIEQPPPVHSNRPKAQKQDVAGSFRASSLVSSSLRSKSQMPSSSLSRPSPLRTISASPEEQPESSASSSSTGKRVGHSRGPSFEIPEKALPEQNGVTIEGKLKDNMDDFQRQHDDEIMKVLAAGTPSHRAAWSNGGKAWGHGEDDDSDDDAFRRRRSSVDDDDAGNDSSRMAGIPGSMPIRIRSLVKKQERLSLASYRPEMMKATLPT